MNRNVIRLTEQDLCNVIKETVVHCIDSMMKDNSNFFRHLYLVKENVSHAPKDYFGNYENQEYLYENLNEGLIVSYDIDRCETYLKKLFPEIINVRSLKFNPYKVRGRRMLSNKNAFVAIDLGKTYTNYLAISNKVYTLLGWFTSDIQIRRHLPNGSYMPMSFNNFNGEFIYKKKNGEEIELQEFLSKSPQISCFSIIVEAKCSERYYQKRRDVFYHATDTQFASKIEAIGLIPKSQGNFPERIYLGKNINDIKQMIRSNLSSITVFQVDAEGLEIYEDPRHPYSYFTYDNIPPSKLNRIIN